MNKIRSAALHTRLMANEIDGVGVALKGGFISDETAVQWVFEIGGPSAFGTLPPGIEQMAGAAE